ncbi:MAG: hypothetical protein ACUBOA_13685 [Candidatus Loosdrechtia sp.]|uniref:hypothetical protein n=1 Tax=Candidatus Loosdrechtia sp. TaxID=3101272 RepID=UPI003A66D477|nr:MAG: hypothetical protein QY305_06715 [Candidatus Jettenia sp. AMX2]
MSAILKEGVLRGKNPDDVSKEKIDKIMNTIIEQHRIPEHEKTANTENRISPELTSSKEEYNAGQFILSNEIVIEGESKEHLEEIRNKFVKELKPSNLIELIMVDRIVSGIWRLKRCLRIESQIMEYATFDVSEYEQGFFRVRKRTEKEITYLKSRKVVEIKNKLEELCQYETMLEDQVYRALKELNKARKHEQKGEGKVLKRAKRQNS